MEQLLDLQRLLLDQFKQRTFYHREIFSRVNFDNSVTGIIGARGVGKTTFLLQTVLQANIEKTKALYVSTDHVYFLENKLLDLVDKLYKVTDIRLLCIDEIHKYPNWQQELKNISDFYLDFKIVFSGSSMIDIIHSKFDLSRRVTLHRFYGFSFREYLEFNLNISLPKISLANMVEQHSALVHNLDVKQILKYFNKYLRVGYFPFENRFSEELQVLQAIENIVQKTVYEDIATLYSLKTPTLLVLEKLYKFVVSSYPGELSAYKLATTLSKDYESIVTYLHYLEQAGLIRGLHKKQAGKAALRNPIKLYPDNPNFIYAGQLAQAPDSLIGKVRETFVINQLQSCNIAAYYSEQGDFKVEDYIFEVGGKNKTRKQLNHHVGAYILTDGVLVGDKDKIPLYLLGFLS